MFGDKINAMIRNLLLFSYPTSNNIEDIDTSILQALDTSTEIMDETPVKKNPYYHQT